MRSIGERVAVLRRQQGLSARALARGAGLSDGAIRRLEHNPDALPREDTLARIAAVLGLSAADLRTSGRETVTECVDSAQSASLGPDLASQLEALVSQVYSLGYRIDALEKQGPLGGLPTRGGVRTGPAGPPMPLGPWPLRGRVCGGLPIEELPTAETRDGPAELAGPDRYLLEVQGDAMAPLGVRDGALLAVEAAEGFRFARGDYVLALIDGDHATLKRFVRNKVLLNEGEARRSVWLTAQSLDFDVQEYAAARVNVRARALAACNPGEPWAPLG